MVARKAARAVEAGLLPVVCVGETKEERDAGDMWEKVSGQVRRVMEELDDLDGGSLVFAYEPIWAIGTGDGHARGRAGRDRPHSGSAQGAQGRRVRRWGSHPLRRLRPPENAAEIMAQEDVDGALVGGASLEVESFMQLVEAAQETVPSEQ